MRQLLNRQLWPLSVLLGVGGAAACTPYLLARSAELRQPAWLATLVLAAVCTLVWQAYRAWGPPPAARQMLPWGLRRWQLLVLLALLLGLQLWGWIPLLQRLAPGVLPPHHQDVLGRMPLVALFLPLLLLLWPWIVTWRVSHSRAAAGLVVVLLSAFVAWLQLQGQGLSWAWQFALVLLKLPRFVLTVLLFHAWGYPGVALSGALFNACYLLTDLEG